MKLHNGDLLLISFVLIGVVFVHVVNSRRRAAHASLPPGPPALPFVGNLLQIPCQNVAQTYAEWGRKYGDVVYMRVFSREVVHLNAAEAAHDLLGARSAIYSDRPRQVMGGELVGRAKSIVFTPYGPRLRTSRRLLADFLSARVARAYWPAQEHATAALMVELVESPERFVEHINRAAAAVVLRLAYGYVVTGEDDRLVKITEALTEITTKATEPGRWAVDSFPWMKHIPAWFPGAGWKKWAAQARKLSDEFTNVPYMMVKERMRDNSAIPSFTSQVLLTKVSQPPTDDEEDIVKYAAGSLYNGATHTTVSLVTTFIMMMVLHPKVQRKAQQEIDNVIGRARLPTMEDMQRLPYVDCVIRETQRFNPPVPLVPHRVMEDDEYRGMRIPGGAWVVANNWAILRDPRVYKNPEEFIPERYEVKSAAQEDALLDPRNFTFGYGRRKCPALHYANAAVFLAITHILATFDISPAVDESGKIVHIKPEFVSGISSQAKPFRCSWTPRSPAAVALVREAASQPAPPLL